MNISQLAKNKVGILGFGREGQAVLAALERVGAKNVCVISDHASPLPAGVRGYFDDAAVEGLQAIDVLVRSPGFRPTHPVRLAADAAGLRQTTSTNIFLAEMRAANLPVIGITGSKGKSTTATLAYLTLQEAKIPSVLIGNIGRASLDELPNILEKRLLPVLELSSYQCDDLESDFGPSIACLLDLFPEHLDWHGSLNNYYRAKLRLAETQRVGDNFFYNASAAREVAELKLKSRAQAINTSEGLHFAGGKFWRGTEELFDDRDMLLRGEHNRRNAIAALAVTELVGARPQDLKKVLASFSGLPYRLYDEGMHQGVRWINDSISTAPEAVAAALDAFGDEVKTVIAGGQDRGYSPETFLDAVTRHGVRTIILLPETGSKIAAAARARALDLSVCEVASLEEAVKEAIARTPSGATCLFSPGAPSYNMYSSFEERGKHLRSLISG